MELKWLEDLICVAEKGHFARAAEERNITQSALSRRIKSLETWLGAELLDRSQHPIRLTQVGYDFMPTARDIVGKSYDAKMEASELTRIAETGLSIAWLHTLALVFIPKLLNRLQQKIGPFETSIIAETRTVEEYLEGLVAGTTDFFICFGHSTARIRIDEGEFPHLCIGHDRMLPFIAQDGPSYDLSRDGHADIPYLEFSKTAFMSQVVNGIIHNAPFRNRLRPVFRASLAESIATATAEGLGITWLPESLVAQRSETQNLVCAGYEWVSEMSINIYRSTANTRSIVNTIWAALEAQTQKRVVLA